MSPPCDGRDGMETAFIPRCKPHPFEPRALRGRFPRLETRGGLFLGHSRSFEKLSGSLHNVEPLGMSGARRTLGGLRPRASRERRLQPEELKGHALRCGALGRSSLTFRGGRARLYGEICPGSSRSLHSHPSPPGVFGRIKNVIGAEEGVKGVGRETGRPLLVRHTRARSRSQSRAPSSPGPGGCSGDVRGAALQALRAGLPVSARGRGHSRPLPRPQQKTKAWGSCPSSSQQGAHWGPRCRL